MLTKKKSTSQNALLANTPPVNSNPVKAGLRKDIKPMDTKIEGAKVKGEAKDLGKPDSNLRLSNDNGASESLAGIKKGDSELETEPKSSTPQSYKKGFSWTSLLFLLLTIGVGIFLLYSFIFDGLDRKS